MSSVSSIFFSCPFKRFIASLFLCSVLLTGTLAIPSRAHAIPVVVTADIPRDPKELGLDAVAWMVAKILVGTLLQELRGFISTGHFGDPLAIVDIRAFFGKLARDTTMAFMGDIENIDIYQPIKQQILQNLARSYTSYTEEMTSTIQDVLIVPEDFTDDFLKGGWVGFMTLLEPRNNIYGQLYMAKDVESRKIAASSGEVKDELSQSGGLLSLPGKCLEYAVTTTFSGNTTTTTPGACVRWERVTPGQFIATTLSNTLGSPVDSLNNADEISELLAAAVNVLVSDIIMKGVTIVSSAANNAVTGALTGSGSSSGPSSSSSSSGNLSSDKAPLITAINNDITALTPLITTRASLVTADASAANTIAKIDTLLTNTFFDSTILSSYRNELTVLRTTISTHIARIDEVGVTSTYLTSLQTIKTNVQNANSISTMLAAYSAYNDTATTVDMTAARKIAFQTDELLIPANRVNEITSAVNALPVN